MALLLSGIVCTIAQNENTLITTTATTNKVGALLFNLALDSRSQPPAEAAVVMFITDLNEINFHADEIDA